MTRAAALLAGGKTIEDVRDVIGERFDDVARWRDLIRVRTDVDVGYECTGTATARLPSASAVCAALGLVT
jgi:hypothetical protein